MNEFFREVDEEYRRDRLLQAWTRYSGLIVGLAVLVIAAAGGWRFYQYSERQKAEAAAMAYADATRLAQQEGSDEAAQAALETLTREAPAGYRVLARLRLAAERGEAEPEAGAAAYDAIAADGQTPPALQDLARLRAALLRMDRVEPAQVQPSLERLAVPTGPFRHTAREMLGLLALKRGDYDGAGRWFDQIAADREAPPSLRSRLQIYSALVAAGPVQSAP